jgi:peptide/nickel transport system substrate-binding protein
MPGGVSGGAPYRSLTVGAGRRYYRRMKHRSARVCLACCVAAVLLCLPADGGMTGCRAGGRHPESAARTLVVGLLSDPGSLNPLTASSTQAKDIIDCMFLKLFKEENDFLHFRPRLASEWTFSPDSLLLSVVLREDVRWHDGVPCTAEDVRFTWECETDTLVSWPGRHFKDRITAVDVTGEHTVVFHFSSAYPNQLMDVNDGVILPAHLLAAVPRDRLRTCEFGRRPVGNGPFRFSHWESKQYIVLERNADYCETGKPRVERVVFRIVPDMITLLAELRTGEIDCLESIPPDDAEAIEKGSAQVRIVTFPSRSMAFISWNCSREPFDDRTVRRALGLAVDRRAIIDAVWKGMATECTSPMHPILWAFDEGIVPLPFDPEQSRSLLASLGWEDRNQDGVLERGGKDLSFEMIANYGNQQRIDIMTMVQAQLAAIGVRVNARVLEWNTFTQEIVNYEYDSCVMGWKVGTRADLKEFWHTGAIGHGGFNISAYSNPAVDRLIDEARNTRDPARARTLWSECQRAIYEDQPFLFLAVPYEIYGLAERFENVEPSPISFFNNLEDWEIGEDPR